MRQERTDDVIEPLLYLRQVTPDSFRRYTLVAENSVAVRTHDVRFVRSKHSANTVTKMFILVIYAVTLKNVAVMLGDN